MFRLFDSNPPLFNRSLKRLKASLVNFFLLGIVFSLTGCIQYEVGVNYAGQFHGEITQQIYLDEHFSRFDPDAVQIWLNSIRSRTRELGGRVRSPSPHQMAVTIPFNNGKELVAKFNQFFQSDTQPESIERTEAIPPLRPHLALIENNLLLVLRNHFILDLDLRSLNTLASSGSLLLYPGDAMNLEFRLSTPWGARVASTALMPQLTLLENQLVWHLKAGQINHLEVIFWVPSPLGVGAVVIIILVGLGIWLKSRISDLSQKSKT